MIAGCAAALGLVLGCSPSSRPGADAAMGAADAMDATSSADASAACVQRAATLQAALDAASATHAAALGIATADCPTLSLVGGEGVASDSLFRVGSVTKTYIAAVIVSLAREGTLSLDDALDEHALPVPEASGITVRQLLNHTSGIFDYTDAPACEEPATRQTPQAPEALVALATAHPPYFAPGTSWRYSNTNYILLGMVAERVSGASLGEIVRARALDPGQLAHTFFDGEEPLVGTLAPGYSASGTDVTNLYHPSWAWAAGAMVATVGDLADWATALYGAAIVDEAGRALLTESPVDIGGGISYGLGTMITSAAIAGNAGVGIGHGGDISGYHTMAFYFPAKQTTIAAAVTSDAASANDVFVAALDALFP